MNNLRNRRRMRMAALLFALMFLVGAAFAFTPGTLTINGNVNIISTTNYVRWESATVSGSSLATNAAISTANIVGARGRTAQHIEWEVTFETPGYVILNVSAFNDHNVFLANLGTPVVTFDNVAATAHGLSVLHDFTSLTAGTLLPLSESAPGWIGVWWDGTLPPGFDYTVAGTNPVLTISVSIDYTAVAP